MSSAFANLRFAIQLCNVVVAVGDQFRLRTHCGTGLLSMGMSAHGHFWWNVFSFDQRRGDIFCFALGDIVIHSKIPEHDGYQPKKRSNGQCG